MGKQMYSRVGSSLFTTAIVAMAGLIAIGCDDRRDQTILPQTQSNVQKTSSNMPPPTRQVAWDPPPSTWKGVQTQQQGEIAFAVSEKDPNLLVRGFLLSPNTQLQDIVNNWEKQLGRTPSDPSAVEATVTKPRVINGIPAKYVDLSSPEGAGEKRRLLGAIVLDQQSKVTFVIAGPEDEVAAERANFDQFIDSIKFVMVQPSVAPSGPVPFRLRYARPPGWNEDPNPPQGIDMVLRKGEGAAEAAIVVTRQSAETAQGYLQDPNKLRQLAMLSPLAQGQQHQAYKVQIGQGDGQGIMFDLQSNPGETPKKRTLFVIVQVNGMAVCVQLAGSADAVDASTKDLDLFLRSLDFVALTGQEAAQAQSGPRVPLPLLDQLVLPPSMRSTEQASVPSTQTGAAQ